jgi:AraC-like DNA-binding protein
MAQRASRIPLIRFSTDDFPARERFAAWHRAMAPMFEIPARGDASEFRGTAFTYLMGRIAFGGTDVDALAYSRTAAKIRTDGIDHYLIRLDFTRENPEGLLFVIDLGQPIELPLAPMHCLCIFVPRDMVDGAMHGIAALHGRIVTGARGRIFADYMKVLASQASGLDNADGPAMADSMIAMMRSCLEPREGTESQTRSVLDATQLGRARRFVDAHLTSADLGPEIMAEGLAMSRASLYRLFRPLGGVARFIQQRRLQRIHDLLSSAEEHRRISEIALTYGFPDEASFSRAFRREYGYTASEARAMRGLQKVDRLAGDPEKLALSPPERMMMWGDWMNRLAE